MTLEMRLPNVYRQHAVLEEAARPFANIPGRLVVSEYKESADWWFTLRRHDGKLLLRVLPTEGRMRLDAALVNAIRDGLATMLAV